jgi:Fic family protein
MQEKTKHSNKHAKRNTTRTRLCLYVLRLLLEKFPVSFTSDELSIVAKANKRTTQRAIADLFDAGLIEKHYTGYRFKSAFAQQFIGSKWYLKQELDSFYLIHKNKRRSNEKTAN